MPVTPFRGLVAALLVLISTVPACGSNPQSIDRQGPQPIVIEVHLWGHFDDDLVEVVVDGESVYQGLATTDPALTLAGIVSTAVMPGTHDVRVFVNGLEGKMRIDVTRELYVGVRYRSQPEPRVELNVMHEPPVYR